MARTICLLFLITLIPGLELRASIPMGILGGKWLDAQAALPWPEVAVVCFVSNVLIGWAIYFLLDPMVRCFRKIPSCDRLLARYLDRAQNKLKPNIEKYGTLGLAVFIGIPLPLTGAYTGAAGAYALGMGRRQFMLANVLGVFIAAVCVTVVTLLIKAGCSLPIFDLLIKH